MLKGSQPLFQVGNAREGCLQLPNQRQQRQDQRILLRRAQPSKVNLMPHSQIAPRRAWTRQPRFCSVAPENAAQPS